MILGLTALAQSGKDTLAGYIKEYMDVKTYALAQPIKDILGALFDWGDEHRDGNLKELVLTYTITPDTLDKAGEVYESYGLDKYEAFHDCWDKLIKLFNIEYKDTEYTCNISPRKAYQLFGTDWGRTLHDPIWLELAPTDNVIITDVRFDNEAKFFTDKGAVLIRVERDGVKHVATHVSENGVSDKYISIIVENNGSLAELDSTAKYLVQTNFSQTGRYARL